MDLQKLIIILMQKQVKKYRELTICDVEQNIEPKRITQFFSTIEHIQTAKKVNNSQQIHICFDTDNAALQFYQLSNFKFQILKKKFNIYYSYFDELDRKQLMLYQLNGVDQDNIRKVFQAIHKIGKCRIHQHFQGNKLFKKIKVAFQKDSINSEQFIKLKQDLSQISIKVRVADEEEEQLGFKCSIQLVNFAVVDKLNLNQEEQDLIKKELIVFMNKISEQPIRSIYLQTFMHKGQFPRIKAYFKFKDTAVTLSEFQKLRKYLVSSSQIDCKLFYFEHQANFFYTLFTMGLQKNEDQSQKQFQDTLINIFRQINPAIVQVIVKEGFGHLWTAKVYFASEQDGKDYLIDYVIKRQLIYQLYRDKTRISFNLFQKMQNIDKIKKLQNNAEKMLTHIKDTKAKEQRERPMIQPYRQNQQYYQNNRNYNQNRDQPNYKQKNREGQEQLPRKTNYKQKPNNKESFKMKIQQFPDLGSK